MKFSVASWYERSPEYWITHNGYTTMAGPPQWSKEHDRNLSLFAPPANIVFGNVPWDYYKQVYRDTLKSRMELIKQWIAEHNNDHMILLCACGDPENCHRSLLAKLLIWLGCEEVALPEETQTEPPNDVVVTVPKSFGLNTWINEGDAAGERWSGQEWDFYLYGCSKPNILPGQRVYIVYNGILRGYAPLIRVDWIPDQHCWSLVRHGDAVAVTIDEHITGFRGWKRVWWNREDEKPFDYEWYDGRPAWMVPMEIESRSEPSLGKGIHVIYQDHVFPLGAFVKKKEIYQCLECWQRDIDVTFTSKNDMIEHTKQEHAQRHLQKKGNEIKARRAEARQKMQEDYERRKLLSDEASIRK